MKVLHLIASVDPATGGPIEGIFQSAAIWTAEGLGERHIASLDAPAAPWVARCPLTVFPLGPRARRYGYAPRFVPWLRANVGNYDAVVVNGLWNYTARGAQRVLVGGPTPYFVFPHGMLDPWFRRSAPVKTLAKQLVWWFADGPLLNNARQVLFTTAEECRLAQGAFWPYRVRAHVLGYGTADVAGDAASQVAAFRAGVPTLGERPFLLFLGRLHPKKGCDLLIEAYAETARADLDLVIAGPD